METLEQETATRGKAFYEKQLKTLLEPQREGEFLAIEPDSGCYFLGRTSGRRWMQRGRRCRRSCFT